MAATAFQATREEINPASQFLHDFNGIMVFRKCPGVSRERFYEKVCRTFRERSKIEMDKKGNVYVMPPGGGESGWRDLAAGQQLGVWAVRKGHGRAFGPSTSFQMPDGEYLVPDAAWASNEKVYGISYEQRTGYIPIVPEFVIEIWSKTDNYRELQGKMGKYIRYGVELAWLIHPKLREVKIYTAVGVDTVKNPGKLRGTGPVRGFTLDLEPIWRGLGDLPKPRPLVKKKPRA